MIFINQLSSEIYSPSVLICSAIISSLISGWFLRPFWIALIVACSMAVVVYIIGLVIVRGMTPFFAIGGALTFIVQLPICMVVCGLMAVQSRR